MALAGFLDEVKQTQTLVVLDSWATVETHSTMFGYLEQSLNHELTFEMADAKIKLIEHDEWKYDNIVFMAPSVKGKKSS